MWLHQQSRKIQSSSTSTSSLVIALFSSASLPSTHLLPDLERLQSVRRICFRSLLWAIAITYTVGRLTRIGWEAARPSLGRLLHSLASAIDAGLLYPDQPEPQPTQGPNVDPIDPLATGVHAATSTPHAAHQQQRNDAPWTARQPSTQPFYLHFRPGVDRQARHHCLASS